MSESEPIQLSTQGMRSRDFLRLRLKDLEFSLPPPLTRHLLRATGVGSPFREEERKLRGIFIHIPKAAGTSIARAIFDTKSRHIPIARYVAFDPSASQAYFKFSIVRNPWARMHSAYHYLARRIGADPKYPDHRWATHFLGGTGDFEGFLKKMVREPGYRAAVRRYIHFRDQLDWICIPGKRDIAVDYVGRYERLEEHFPVIASRLGLDVALPRERIGAGKDYREAYSDAMRQFVGDLYDRDLHVLDYGFDA